MEDRILTPRLDRHLGKRLNGYYYSRVTVRGFGRHHVHRLVAQTWIKNDLTSNDCVCHKDETVSQEFIDSVSNLWIGTKGENSKDRHRKGRSKGGRPKETSFLTRQRVHVLKRLGLTNKSVSDLLNIHPATVGNVVRRDLDTNNYINEGGV